MSIENLRDLIIVIYGVTATVGTIILVILALVLYSRLKPILDSIRKTTATIARITSSVEDVVAKPLAQIKSFVQGIRNAMCLVKKFTGREED
jgi:hypothetical protein